MTESTIQRAESAIAAGQAEEMLRAMARDLAVMRGEREKPEFGKFIRLPLGDVSVLVEYGYTPADPGRLSGPPEDCYPPQDEEIELLGVFLNGMWVEPTVIAEDVREQWEQSISEAERDKAEAIAADRDEREPYYG